jgi:transcriptional activator of cad operon
VKRSFALRKEAAKTNRMTWSPAAQLQIGDWSVDPVGGLISQGDSTVQLEARTLRLLLYLAGKPGEVVSIDELLDEVWPGVTVTPDSVYQAVASLRRQLGDDPKRPRYIANVPRLGYRMVAKIGAPLDKAAASRKPRRIAWIALPVVLLGLVGAIVAWGPMRAAPPSAVAALQAAKVGVLPFLDMTDAMDQEVFTDNLTEDIIDRLSRTEGLSTPGPRSSFALKGQGLTATDAARKLGVDFMLDGSVRKAGRTNQFTVRLVRGDTGFVIWSKTYDAPASGLGEVQLDVAREVARMVRAARGA